jgi:uncharacterized protein YjiS (DUF1127 family)
MKYIVSGVSGFFKSLQKSQQQRADYWILNNMSDKDLRDIGITRGEIRSKIFEG